MQEQQMILVNERDEAIGTMGKMEVHRKGLLHRAFSIFIFDSKGRMLLHQRAGEKYHGAHLWTNACCSHPFPGEQVRAAAARRLEQELGFSTPLNEVFCFTYKVPVENGLIEHEFDHVLVGEYEGPIQPDEHEVADYKYLEVEQIGQWLQTQPGQFTSWFRIAFPEIENWWKKEYRIKRKVV